MLLCLALLHDWLVDKSISKTCLVYFKKEEEKKKKKMIRVKLVIRDDSLMA